MATRIPGDWTTRGAVIAERSEFCSPVVSATPVEILRAIAGMIRAGQTVTRISAESPMGRTDANWIRVIANHLGDSRDVRRDAAKRAIRNYIATV